MGVVHQVVHVAAEHLLRPVAEHVGARAVDEHASAFEIDAIDPLGQVISEETVEGKINTGNKPGSFTRRLNDEVIYSTDFK
jgi:hypothetical protein